MTRILLDGMTHNCGMRQELTPLSPWQAETGAGFGTEPICTVTVASIGTSCTIAPRKIGMIVVALHESFSVPMSAHSNIRALMHNTHSLPSGPYMLEHIV